MKTPFLILIFVGFCYSYTLKPGEVRTHFPVQQRLPILPKSFQRFHKDKVEIVDCPTGFVFDTTTMTCQVNPMGINLGYAQNICPINFSGPVSDPFNCRNFINCHDGFAFSQTCAAHLLFSAEAKRCEWPEESQCCEYMENKPSPSKYVGLPKAY